MALHGCKEGAGELLILWHCCCLGGRCSRDTEYFAEVGFDYGLEGIADWPQDGRERSKRNGVIPTLN